MPCPGSCALATRVASGIRRFPRRAAASCDVAAQVGRVPVAFVDIAAFENFGFAGGRSRSSSQTIRRPALLVWCSFGHHQSRTPRGVRSSQRADLRGYHPGSIPCGLGRMTRTHQTVSGGCPDVSSVVSRTDIPRACVHRGRWTGNRVCPERKCWPDPVEAVESRSIVRRRDKSRRRALGHPPWGF